MLTVARLRNLKNPEKRQRLHDDHGLYLEVTPTGGRWWRYKFRYAGKEKRLSLGTYPEVGLAEARAKRDDMRRQIRNGVDPSEQRRARKAAIMSGQTNSFEDVAREWHAVASHDWTERYTTNVIRRLEINVFPYLGHKPVAAIAPAEILDTMRRLTCRSKVYTAHRVLEICKNVFSYAVRTGRRDANPATDLVKALPKAKEQNRAAILEPARVGALLRACDAYSGSFVVRAALRLAPLVFVRPGELRAARWADIDTAGATWSYRVTKTGADHIVPLSRQALAILDEIRPLTGRGEFVFPSARTPGRPMSDAAVLAALRAMGFEKSEMSGHGWRATARTLLDEVLGFRLDAIEHQLAHTVRDPLGTAYNRTTMLPERRAMMQRWADYLDELRAGTAAS